MLPSVDTIDELDALVSDEAVLRPAVLDLCDRLGLVGLAVRRFDEGSLPVYAIGGDLVLKLYPRFDTTRSLREARVLEHLWGRLPLPTPRLLATDEYAGGWRFVLMSRLPGLSLAEAWPRLEAADRDRIVTESAETLAALHAMDFKALTDVVGPSDWGSFLSHRRSRALAHHRANAVPEPWLSRIPGFLDSVPLPASTELALLHTEFMRDHLTVDLRGGRRLTGLFDFEPAMIGDPAYDFVSVGLFLTRGDPRRFRRFYQAYGRAPYDPDQLLAYTLLHVYSDFPLCLHELPTPPEPRLDTLAETWFGTEG
ncbi:phosphotransferase family protein [Streptomyces nodosus]|uniref:Phosphotransferase n=1 Tax=Streptomyces nodosus TaxID=40318 RepID=A0A0B5DL22_9ACTN|nr:aminoglycoside phosphotransferase family protein [Streptomyces nodosus]AJE41870.1 phosphotransferase [Streptomyces nodosus]MBB4793107.1 hygromycin-B 7''-O-kinase [Streptomyces nodosus]QEV43362.1 aminoglycoside phosphotransferase family protein [Streptomyces nodosus]